MRAHRSYRIPWYWGASSPKESAKMSTKILKLWLHNESLRCQTTKQTLSQLFGPTVQKVITKTAKSKNMQLYSMFWTLKRADWTRRVFVNSFILKISTSRIDVAYIEESLTLDQSNRLVLTWLQHQARCSLIGARLLFKRTISTTFACFSPFQIKHFIKQPQVFKNTGCWLPFSF